MIERLLFVVSGINLITAIIVLRGSVLNHRTAKMLEEVNDCNRAITKGIQQFLNTAGREG